jgi:hypothetical protein
MVPSEGNMSLKNPVTQTGIDPGTVRLVAQRLKHIANPGITYLLTPWSRILLEKLTGFAASQEIPRVVHL